MKKIIYLIFLLPFFAYGQGSHVNGTIQRNATTGVTRYFNSGAAGIDTLSSVTGMGVNGYVLVYNSTLKKSVWTNPTGFGTNFWQRSGTTLSPATAGDDILTTGNVQADTVKGTAAIFNSSSKTLQVQFSGSNVFSVNSTLAGASAPGGVYANTLISGSTQLSNLTVTNLNAGGLVKAVSPSGLVGIATPGTDYLAPGTAVLLTGNQSIAGNKTFTDDVNITGTDGTPSLTVTASGSVSRAISAATSGSSSIAIIADGTSGASGVVASAGNGAYGVQGNNTGSGWGGGFTSVSGPAIAAVSTSGVGGTFQSGSANIAEFYGSGATLKATVAQSGSISSTPQGTLYGTATGSITSSQLSTSLTNETGTGNAVFSASPTFTGTITAEVINGTSASFIRDYAGNPALSVFNTSSTGNGLFVKGGGGSNYALYVTDYIGETPFFEIKGNGNTLLGGASDESITLNVNGTGKFSSSVSMATSSGVVLIGTTTSNSYPLGIEADSFGNLIYLKRSGANSQIFMGGTTGANTVLSIRSNGSGGVSLSDGATSWAAISDENTKRMSEFVEFTSPLSKVSSLRAGISRYKTDSDSVKRSFLIAQDVQKVLPEAVSISESGILSLRYSDVIPLLVGAIKELKLRIETLEK